MKTLMRLLLQKQSDLGLHCFSLPFWQATNVQNFRMSSVFLVFLHKTWSSIQNFDTDHLAKARTSLHIPIVSHTQRMEVQLSLKGAQWLGGRVLESIPRGCGFEPHQCHCVVSLRKT